MSDGLSYFINTNARFFLVAGKCTNADFIPGVFSYATLLKCCNINFGTGSLKVGECIYIDECNTPRVPPTSKPSNKPAVFAAPSTSKPIDPSKSPSSNPSTSLAPTHSPTSSPTIEPSATPTYYPSYSPTMTRDVFSTPISAKCSKSETRIRIEVLTDSFPRDTSWVFKRKREKNGRDGALLLRSREYKKVLQRDIRELCLNEGTYEFIIRDVHQDGLCCDHGNGHYKISTKRNFDDDWQLIVAGAEFVTKEVRHVLQVQKHGQLEIICKHPQRKISVEIKTDNFGEDTSWQFRDKSGVIIAKNERVYGKKELDSRDLCLDDKSLYEFIVFDTYGDGLCCQFGEGYYKIITYTDDIFHENITSPDGVTVLHGGMFFEQNITHNFNTTMPLLLERDLKWLEAHNVRRKKYHAEYETEYVPLQWSDGLKAEGTISMFIYDL